MLVGTGLECTKGTIEFTRIAADCGADVAVVITPHFFKSNMSHEAFMKHYLMIADSSPIPVLLYNVPSFTGLNLEAGTASALSSHENIIGIKDSSGNVEQLSENNQFDRRERVQRSDRQQYRTLSVHVCWGGWWYHGNCLCIAGKMFGYNQVI